MNRQSLGTGLRASKFANQAITFVNTIRDGVVSPTDTSFRPTVLPPKVKQQ